MTTDLTGPDRPVKLAALYRAVLLDDVMPFWLRHFPAPEHYEWFGYLHRDGTLS